MSGHHIVTPQTYFKVLIGLFILMGLTIAAAYVHVGPEDQHVFNLLIALAIATCKVFLIMSFFMHVKYGSNLTKVFATCGFLWLAIFFVLLFDDYVARAISDSPFTGSPYGG